MRFKISYTQMLKIIYDKININEYKWNKTRKKWKRKRIYIFCTSEKPTWSIEEYRQVLTFFIGFMIWGFINKMMKYAAEDFGYIQSWR